MLFLTFFLTIFIEGKSQSDLSTSLQSIQLKLDTSNYACKNPFHQDSLDLDYVPEPEHSDVNKKCSQRAITEFFPRQMKVFIANIQTDITIGVSFEQVRSIRFLEDRCLQNVIAQNRGSDSALGQIRIIDKKGGAITTVKNCTGTILSSTVIITLKECFHEDALYEFQPRIFHGNEKAWLKAKNSIQENNFSLIILEKELDEKISKAEMGVGRNMGLMDCRFFIQGYLPNEDGYVKTSCPGLKNSEYFFSSGCDEGICSLEGLQDGSPLFLSCETQYKINHLYFFGMKTPSQFDDSAIFLDESMYNKIQEHLAFLRD